MNHTTDYDKLFDLKEDASFDESLRGKLTLLYKAMTDWPGSSGSIGDFTADVKLFLKTDILTFKIIHESLTGIDAERYAWQLESLASLKELAFTEKDITVDEIILHILA